MQGRVGEVELAMDRQQASFVVAAAGPCCLIPCEIRPAELSKFIQNLASN